MNTEAPTYTLDELCALIDISKRTVRYYIQQGLIPGPEGKNRGARYHQQHVERLLELKKWQAAGLSLERIAELLNTDAASEVPLKPTQPGSVEIWSHLIIADGVQLMIEPGRSKLTSEQIRKLSRTILQAYQDITEEEEKC